MDLVATSNIRLHKSQNLHNRYVSFLKQPCSHMFVSPSFNSQHQHPTNQRNRTRDFAVFPMPQDEASKVRLQEAKKDLAALGEELAPLRARYQQAGTLGGMVEAMVRYE